MPEQAEVQFGREICGDLAAAESREWLVTNGIGGYASGTVAGSQTRRYHGLLVAALQPPVGRTQLVSAIDEIVHYAGTDFSLATDRWASGAVNPQGFLFLEDFHLAGSTPVWTYALADALLEKRVWMPQGENTTYIQYTLVRGSSALEMELKALVNYRDFHSLTHAGDWRMNIAPLESGVKVLAFDGATPFYLKSSLATCEPRHEWYLGCFLGEETARGLSDREDRLFAALFRARLEIGCSVVFVATTEANAFLDGETARAERANYEVKLFQDWQAKNEGLREEAPSWLWQLILAADQFIVKRSLPEEPDGRSIIAGYHWFGDWGRDTMIALPGLTLATGRAGVARQILLAFLRYVDGGMLPNNFPDAGGKPEYNAVDAALWYFESIRQYFEATQDAVTLQKLFPVLAGMIDAHIAGMRYHIHVDPADGLLYAGAPGVQLTWMDAKIGDWVVTPRAGKPVEINALWINALETMAGFARLLAKPSEAYERLSAKAKKSFQKFWNAERNCCFDVVDSPGIGNDAALRPNQIFAVSLPASPLAPEQQKAAVDVCARQLLTSHGLRSLAPGEPGYTGHYGGSPRDRDAAYHQGTVWGWLLGPFALAHYRVYQDREAALRFLEPLGRQIYSSGLGTVSEIFDGDAPFTPRGCISQAWTVAEVLRAWKKIADEKKPAIGQK
ncbi:MAG TPA: amylo-alpha-1,6-glucosidase [Candidatus Limnocylindria bacterium]|nr:amylo-alpha-1,6-glucosidase [Candidatus Limnocylindria bacterium]